MHSERFSGPRPGIPARGAHPALDLAPGPCYPKSDQVSTVSRKRRMIRMTRLTDYGIMLLTLFARDDRHPMKSARDLSREARLPLPTVSKILKLLARHGLLK